jgi:hypothetical protein
MSMPTTGLVLCRGRGVRENEIGVREAHYTDSTATPAK